MPQWKPPTDTNLPAVPPMGATLSPHQRWVAKQLSEMPQLSPRQQAWLEATRQNQKGKAADPRETVPKVNAEQAEAAATRIGMGSLGDLPIAPPRSPLPSQEPPAGPSTTRQNSMGVRRRRKITEEEEEEFDANSQAHHPATETPPPPMPPPPPPPSSYDDDAMDDDDFDGEEEEEEEEEEEPIERVRDRNYPPPRAIQPYDHRTDVMIEKFGQVANQMIHVVKENSFMAQQSAQESRRGADMIRENANAMLKTMLEVNNSMIRSFQENATKMMEVSAKMVIQADARRDAAEASQLKAMETYQTALTREAEAKIQLAQAETAMARAQEIEDELNNAPPSESEDSSEESEGMMAGLVGKGIANAAGPIIEQVVSGVMGALGANGPKLNEEMVRNIAETTAKAMIESRQKARAAAQSAANQTPPTKS